tara:strand:+ start:1789 stop:2058 length:270 start_codon:yes stop_codon:yes gene_type:complete
MNQRTMEEMAAIENERMLQNAPLRDKVDLRARAYDVIKTRDAWTLAEMAKGMRVKEGAAQQALKELEFDGYVTCKPINDKLVYKFRKEF